jgi:hypothetical protein
MILDTLPDKNMTSVSMASLRWKNKASVTLVR